MDNGPSFCSAFAPLYAHLSERCLFLLLGDSFTETSLSAPTAGPRWVR